MVTAKLKSVIPLLAASSLLVTACGGGSGSSGDDDTVPTVGVSITTANAKSVGAAAVNSLDVLTPPLAGTLMQKGGTVSAQRGRFDLPDFIVRQILTQQRLDPQSVSTITGVAISEVIECPNGGSFTRTGEVTDEFTSTAGDSLDVSFSNCNVDGDIINGSLSLIVSQAPGLIQVPPYILAMDVLLTNLSLTSGGETVTSNGDFSTFLAMDAENNLEWVFSGRSLTTSSPSLTGRLTDYSYNMQYNATSFDFNTTMQGTIASTGINGSVTFTTIVPFTENEYVAQGDQTAGQMHITTSADNSQAWLIAEPDGINVTIKVDADGDNVAESTVTTTWRDLDLL